MVRYGSFRKENKKMKKIIILFVLLASLVACGTTKEVETICQQEYGDFVLEVSYFSKKDKIERMEQVATTTVDGVSDEEVAEVMDAFFTEYNAITGVTYAYTYANGELVEIITMDFNKMSNSDMISLGVLGYGDANVDYISLEKTLDNQKAAGVTCTTK